MADEAEGGVETDAATVIERVAREYAEVFGETDAADLNERIRRSLGVFGGTVGCTAAEVADALAAAEPRGRAASLAMLDGAGDASPRSASVSSASVSGLRIKGGGGAERVKSRAAGPVGRNAACPCGSGRKFKACCRGVAAFEVSLDEEVAVAGDGSTTTTSSTYGEGDRLVDGDPNAAEPRGVVYASRAARRAEQRRGG